MKLQTFSGLRTFAFAALTAASISTATPARAADDRQPDHIFFIMMENHGTNQIIGNTADAPFIKSMVK